MILGNMSLKEYLHAASMGDVAGITPEVADTLVNMGGAEALVEEEERQTDADRNLVKTVLDELLEEGEIRPQAHDTMMERHHGGT